VASLHAAINDGLKTADIRDSLAKIGAEATPGSPQDFANFIAVETKKWSTVAKMAGISLE
jgi:tripartite-type tricarboxylate transporter receptor subunit TctC